MTIHHFDIEHAGQYGVVEAVLISNLQFWISKNAANGVHQHAGRTWTYNTAKAFTLLFPYLSDRQIRRTIDNLTNQAVLIKGNFNKSACDRTLWLAFLDESAFLTIQKPAPKTANGSPKSARGSAGIGESLTTTDIKPDTGEIGFASFWSAYPKKTAKPAALKAYRAAKVSSEEQAAILGDIAVRASSEDWTKEGGKYTPNPATYLNQRRWEDGQAPAAAKVRFV